MDYTHAEGRRGSGTFPEERELLRARALEAKALVEKLASLRLSPESAGEVAAQLRFFLNNLNREFYGVLGRVVGVPAGNTAGFSHETLWQALESEEALTAVRDAYWKLTLWLERWENPHREPVQRKP